MRQGGLPRERRTTGASMDISAGQTRIKGHFSTGVPLGHGSDVWVGLNELSNGVNMEKNH